MEPTPPHARGYRGCTRTAHQRTDLHQDQISPTQTHEETQQEVKGRILTTSPTKATLQRIKKITKNMEKNDASEERAANSLHKCSTKEPKSTLQSTQTITEGRETPFPTPPNNADLDGGGRRMRAAGSKEVGHGSPEAAAAQNPSSPLSPPSLPPACLPACLHNHSREREGELCSVRGGYWCWLVLRRNGERKK